ncbi:hypothetical protein GCM10007304_44340 [Rhodococcoides trifolii]|uniref:HTH hxlR-type domain-containing protein n=1 Tax=Rhodococcoides trifolii TaxID=908250 RepID=A0A917LI22_9NOCA|nr:winged helix-turn-helix transcriptional regulator [Rhodococcus trifolii]GGG25638.1 hypothetical protein GCM10007304_44340 [Rhodococcus trifolii]
MRLGVDLISHRWDAVVLTALRAGPSRRTDLLSTVGGISDKSLHESLARLHTRRLVDRDETGRRYRLTELGTSLATGPLLMLAQWAETHQQSLSE